MSELGFDPERLAMFLRTRLPGASGPARLARIGAGQSNPTFLLDIGERRLVLRKKPPGTILPSAHAVEREARVLQALAESRVPVPPVVLAEPSSEVIGTPFYLMERLEGRVITDNAMPGVAPSERRAMFVAMATTLAALHELDWRALGLGDYGRPEGYYARQVARWTRQWQAQRFRDLPDLERLAVWVDANLPADDGVAALCHGDFRLGNLMFHPTEPRVIAVLDWELSTIGHPLADLAYSALAWRSTPAQFQGLAGLDLASLGLPSEADYLAAYAAARRTPAPALTRFHHAFAAFRFAVILEGVAARARAGNAAAADAALVGELSRDFAAIGLAATD
ncbi:MAG: phosphotransferase family protein [Rhodospirillales bacterium]|nr:phosphotransferase family protein [Rhodospirillales bacterium]